MDKFYSAYPELKELRGTMLEPYIFLHNMKEETQKKPIKHYNLNEPSGPIKYQEYFYKLYSRSCATRSNHLETVEYCKGIAKAQYQEYISNMKTFYKIAGWSCMFIAAGCFGGIGGIAALSGLTLFWIGANLEDAKCF